MNDKKFRKLIFTALTAFFPMVGIRKVKTKSGSTAMQVVQYTRHSAKIVNIQVVPEMILRATC